MTRRTSTVLGVSGTIAGLALLLAGCGIPADDGFQEFDADELPRELTETTTTTTTSVPPPTPPSTPPSGPLPETSTTLVQTQPVDIYFVIGVQLQPQSVQLLLDVSPAQVVAQLEQGPVPGPGSVGLRTVVREGLVSNLSVGRGLLTVDLNGDVLRRTSQRDQPLAIAQLVLSLGRLPGVGQIAFTQDGEPLAVPVPARDGEFSEPGEPLVFDDFAPLLASTSTPPATTTTTTTQPPSTQEPPPSEPGTTAPPG
jgi:hypothetical protein